MRASTEPYSRQIRSEPSGTCEPLRSATKLVARGGLVQPPPSLPFQPMDIGLPETEQELEITPLEEPVPAPSPVEEPAEEPVPA